MLHVPYANRKSRGDWAARMQKSSARYSERNHISSSTANTSSNTTTTSDGTDNKTSSSSSSSSSSPAIPLAVAQQREGFDTMLKYISLFGRTLVRRAAIEDK